MKLLALITLAVTLVILVIGLILMSVGGDINKKYGNKLMTARIFAQAIAVIALSVLYFIDK